MTGKVGRDVTADEARQSAELVAVNILAAVKVEIGQLSAVERVVKLLGMVNAEPDFIEHPYVIDGCSDLFYKVLGEVGTHARSAVGVSSLPNNITVEIEAIIEVDD